MSSEYLVCAGPNEHSIQGDRAAQARQGQLLITWSAPGSADCQLFLDGHFSV